MKRNREQIRINPIDAQPNVAVGISLPFNGKPVFNSNYTTKDQVKTNLINYFLTNKGERIFNPDFGGDLRAFLFEQVPQFDQLNDYVLAQIDLYFPMITVTNFTVDVNTDTNTVLISLSYSINNSSDNVQLQFNG